MNTLPAFHDDLKKFVPSQQRPLSPDQKKAIAELEKAGAAVFVARDFDSFADWFAAQFLSPPFA